MMVFTIPDNLFFVQDVEEFAGGLFRLHVEHFASRNDDALFIAADFGDLAFQSPADVRSQLFDAVDPRHPPHL
jgi:hypothetical protein